MDKKLNNHFIHIHRLYTPKYIYNNDLDKKYVNVKIVKNTEYYIFIQLLKKIKKALLKK